VSTDLERIERLQRAHYRTIVNLIAESAPGECVVLYSVQLLELRAKRADGALPSHR
jgi:hypothetical protein